MAGTKRWIISPLDRGVGVFTLRHWRWFGDFINQRFLDYRHYVFRGHSSDKWKLESTLDRTLKSIPKNRRDDARAGHLERFKLATRGRRGPNPREPRDDDEWWALGQHHGLFTPLLDWTQSPFVALYFAFYEVEAPGSDYRAIWSIAEGAIQEISDFDTKYADVRVIKPLSNDNARLVNQQGLFVRCPPGITLEDACRATFAGAKDHASLIQFRIPNKDRTDCLRFLNRMNINHLTLFPDLLGASTHCNTDIAIKNY